MHLSKVLTLAVMLLFLNGCSLLETTRSTQPVVYLSKSVSWQLPDGDVLPKPFTVLQQVRARYGEQTFELLFQVENRKNGRLVMAALTPVGFPLIQLSYHHGLLDGEVSPIMGEKIKPSYILSDFLLTFASSEALQPALMAAGISMKEGDRQRRLYDSDGRLIVTVDYRDSDQKGWPFMAHYQNHALGYDLEIETLQGEFES